MMKRKIILSIAFLTLATLAKTQINDPGGVTGKDENSTNIISIAVPFLTITPDARAAGMGDIGVATKPDANSTYWNPSKIVFMKDKMGVSLSFTPWLKSLGIEDMYIGYLSGYYKFSENQAITAALTYFTLGSVEFRQTADDPSFDFTPNEMALNVGYSLKLSDHFSGAVGFKYINSNLTGEYSEGAKAGQAVGADISIYYQNTTRLANDDYNYALGLNISNIGSKISYSDANRKTFLPCNMRFGGSIGKKFDEFNELSIGLDFNKLLVPTPREDHSEKDLSVISGIFNSFYEAPGGFSEKMNEITISPGLEYTYNNLFSLRGGYFYESKTKGNRNYVTVGGGLSYNILTVDVAYLISTTGNNNPLANTVRFSLSFRFK